MTSTTGGEITVDRGVWRSFAVVIAGSLLIALDSTVVNLALPSIRAHFGTDNVYWVVTANLIGIGISQPGAAWLIDRVGGRITMIGSLVLVALASIAGGATNSFGLLIATRFGQGVATGALVPVSLAVISHAFPPRRRGAIMGVWSMVSMVAPAIGPLLGGYLLTRSSWRWSFWLNTPIAVVALAGAVMWLQDYVEPTRPSLDWFGWILAAIGVMSLLVAFSQAQDWGWGSPRIIGLLIAAAVTLTALPLWDRDRADPIVNFSLFKGPGFPVTMFAIGVGSIAFTSRLVFMSTLLRDVRGLDELAIGWLLLPAALVTMLASYFGGRLTDRVGAARPIMCGGFLLIVAHIGLASLHTDSSRVWIVALMSAQAMGSTLVVLPATVAALDSLPPSQAGQVSVIRSVFRQVTGALGVATLATLFRSRPRDTIDQLQAAYGSVFRAMIVLGVAALAFGALLQRARSRERMAAS